MPEKTATESNFRDSAILEAINMDRSRRGGVLSSIVTAVSSAVTIGAILFMFIVRAESKSAVEDTKANSSVNTIEISHLKNNIEKNVASTNAQFSELKQAINALVAGQSLLNERIHDLNTSYREICLEIKAINKSIDMMCRDSERYGYGSYSKGPGIQADN